MCGDSWCRCRTVAGVACQPATCLAPGWTRSHNLINWLCLAQLPRLGGRHGPLQGRARGRRPPQRLRRGMRRAPQPLEGLPLLRCALSDRPALFIPPPALAACAWLLFCGVAALPPRHAAQVGMALRSANQRGPADFGLAPGLWPSWLTCRARSSRRSWTACVRVRCSPMRSTQPPRCLHRLPKS